MALGVWQRSIVDESGNVQSTASIEVRSEAAGQPLVSLYSDRDGLSALGNPFNADNDGFARFYCTGGAYRITVTKGAFSREWRHVPIGLAAEGDFLTTGLRFKFSTDTAESDPASGWIRVNSGTLANITELYIDNNSWFGTDISDLIDLWDDYGDTSDRGVLQLVAADGGAQIYFQLTGAVEAVEDTDGEGYRKLTGSVVSSGGTFTMGEFVHLNFSGRGVDGQDGTNGTDGDDGADGADGIQAGLRYQFSNLNTDSDPGAGWFRFNSGTPASVTQLFLSNTGYDGATLSTILDALDDGGDTADRGFIQVTNTDGSATWVGTIQSSVIDGTGYRKINVSYVSHNGTFTGAELTAFTIGRRGADGADGMGSGTVTHTNSLSNRSLVRGNSGSDITIVNGTETVPNNDLDDITETSILPADSAVSNRPGNTGNWLVLTMRRTSTIFTQLAMSRAATNPEMYIRHNDGSTAGWTAWSRVLDSVNDVASLVWVIDGGGSAITTGVKGDLPVPFDCVLTGYTILADQSGSIVVDVWNDTLGNFPPTDADSLVGTGGTEITISGDTDANDDTLTGWDTALTGGTTLRFNVDSISSIERVTILLKVRRT